MAFSSGFGIVGLICPADVKTLGPLPYFDAQGLTI